MIKINRVFLLANIIMVIMGLFGMSIARPFLTNIYWILAFNIVTPILLFIVGFCVIVYGIEEMKEELWRKYQDELDKLKKL